MKFRRIPSDAKGANKCFIALINHPDLHLKDLKDQTLHIRIAGVDAPEVC